MEKFQSTLPARGATPSPFAVGSLQEISIHAPRTGSDGSVSAEGRKENISIHAPRTGSDNTREFPKTGAAHFNPRSPHGERRAGESRLRRADSISIHAPRTGSDRSGAGRTAVHLPISIHAPRTGSDIINNSTFETIKISIHAPRTGSDRESPAHGAGLHYFNPRSPHGERHAPHQRRPSAFDFNHAPRTGSDATLSRRFLLSEISIHAPRTGSDGNPAVQCQ